MNITKYAKAGYGLLAIETFEIKRATESIKVDEPRKLFIWNMIDGLVGVENGGDYRDFATLCKLMTEQQQSVFLLENVNFFFESEEFIQLVLNTYKITKAQQNTIVFLGATLKLPPQFEKIVTKLHFELPKKDEFRDVMNDMINQIKADENIEIPYNEKAADACIGLAREEGENALALALQKQEDGTWAFSTDTVMEMKREMFKSTGFMDFIEPQPINNFGGNERLIDWMYKRLEPFNNPMSIKPKIKAIMLIGVPGCGKSLFCQVLASIMQRPIIDLDVGSLKGGIVGETEKNWRLATSVIDASGEIIIRIDEIEKMFAGGASSVQTNSVDAGELGFFLKWAQESKREGILIVTANNIKQLPTEFLRIGRWDAIFFVDFPNFDERKQIINIMNRRYQSELPTTDVFIESLDRWTGAEIEGLAKDWHYDDLEEAMEDIPLINKTKQEELKELEKYRNVTKKANKASKRIKKVEERKVTLSEKVHKTPEPEEDKPMVDAKMKKSLAEMIKERKKGK